MPSFARSDDTDTLWDAVVAGGGINGCGIARDLAGRGLKVLLCEKDDLAQHTSSRATKLIHGGVRYLEHCEFALVRKALLEREVLMNSAPHITTPLRFVMPHDPSMRAAWVIRLGLFLYDHLARRRILPGSCAIRLDRHVAGRPLKPLYTQAFVFSDGAVDDARLVVLNALDAHERGARVLTRTRCVDAQPHHGLWSATLEAADGERTVVRSRTLVNAAGPWAARFLHEHAQQPRVRPLRLVKGSHIVVKKLYDHDHAYVFQSPDRRIIFTIPYLSDYTLIGTTDVEYNGALDDVRIDSDEVRYLCEQASRYFHRPVAEEQVVWSFAGVRPLLDDASGNPSEITRDYRLELEHAPAPLLSVWGGKLTTYRKLSEHAGDLLCKTLGSRARAWTAQAVLPGGDLRLHVGPGCAPSNLVAGFADALRCSHPSLPAQLLRDYAGRYGTRTHRVLEGVREPADLGAQIVPGLYECEARYLMRHEWAQTAEDILWRRTKLGLRQTPQGVLQLQRWLQAT